MAGRLIPLLFVVTCLITRGAETSPVPKPGRIHGWAKGPNGEPATRGTVTLTSDQGRSTQVNGLGADGGFVFQNLQPGAWNLTVEAAGFRQAPALAVTVAEGEERRIDVQLTADRKPVISSPDPWSQVVAGALVLCYLLIILLTRWFKIARPSQNFLRAQIDNVLSRLDHEVERDLSHQADISKLRQQLADIRIKALGTGWRGIFEFLFWSQGGENAAWIKVHEIEREMVAYLAPQELVRTNLIAITPQLKALQGISSAALAAEIEAELLSAQPNLEFRRRVLGQATAMIYQQRDENFTTLMEWQNKAMWLTLVACLTVLAMGAVAGHLELFLAGAAGGLLSRLMRTLVRQSVPLDYGASWTTLFLSPLLGALAAWFGIALITLLADPDLKLLGAAFQVIQWSEPVRIATVAVAFALGFSERLFNSLVEVLENQAIRAGGTQNLAGTGATNTAVAAAAAGAAGGATTTARSGTAQQTGTLVEGSQSANLSDAAKVSATLAARLKAGDTAKVWPLLKAVGLSVDERSTAEALATAVRTAGMNAASDPALRQRYIAEARKHGVV